MVRDFTKGGIKISYNHLNLPIEVDKFSNYGAMNVKYIYAADGTKQRKIVNELGTINRTDYSGGYIYRNDKLEFIRTAEGYAMPSGSGYRYVYEYKDHLGNIRLSYTDANGDGKVTKSEIIEENNFYPFGLKHKGYNTVLRSTGNDLAQKYKYNGKELNEELGLNWYDYGARNYQADLGRWFNVDPLAEKYFNVSSYNYCVNNPIRFIDPDGKSPDGYRDLNGNYEWLENEHSDFINSSGVFMQKVTDDRVVFNMLVYGASLDDIYAAGSSSTLSVAPEGAEVRGADFIDYAEGWLNSPSESFVEGVVKIGANIVYSLGNDPYSLFTGKTIGGTHLTSDEKVGAFSGVAGTLITGGLTKSSQVIKTTEKSLKGYNQFMKGLKETGFKFTGKNWQQQASKAFRINKSNQKMLKDFDVSYGIINVGNTTNKELKKK